MILFFTRINIMVVHEGIEMRILLLSSVLLVASCGQESGEPGADCVHRSGIHSPEVNGKIYLDADHDDHSIYSGGLGRGDEPLKGNDVRLLGKSRDSVFTSCDDGFFGFGDLANGIYILQPELEPGWKVTTRNRPDSLVRAVEEGAINLVAFGDSLPVEGHSVRFPERLAEHLSPLAEVELHNKARGGTTSEDWLPGGYYFDGLGPVLPDADVVVVSLGGNDILYFFQDMYETGDFSNLEERFDIVLDETTGRLFTIVGAVREQNPDVDIIYLLYPNYATCDGWAEMLGPFQDFIVDLFDSGILKILDSIDAIDPILLIDMYHLIIEEEKDLDIYLADELHFNALGHSLVADEALRALGIARVGENQLGLKPHFGMEPE
jgi:lysophospholipase L1-like esterase